MISWNGGSEATLPGWTYRQDPGQQGYTVYGWSKDSGAIVNFSWLPRVMQKRDYYTPAENAALLRIDAVNKTPSGENTLNVYESAAIANDGGPGAWFMWPSNTSSMGFAPSGTNRAGWYMLLSGDNAWNPAAPSSETVHLGTYTCWPTGVAGNANPETEESNATTPSWWDAEVAAAGGTKQAGNHYYHVFGIPGDVWAHVTIDQHPTHARNSAGYGKPKNDPVSLLFPSVGKTYLEVLNRLYLEKRYPQSQVSQYHLGPIAFYQDTEDSNTESITSLWVGRHKTTGKWHIGWQDMSFYHVSPYNYDNTTKSTFEVRWSTSPITNANFDSATIIEPEYYEQGVTNRVKRFNSWAKGVWTQFDIAQTTGVVYFAVKDVSSISNYGDGRDSVSQYIHTIDYVITPQGKRYRYLSISDN